MGTSKNTSIRYLSDLSIVSKGDGNATLHMINTVERSYRDLARIGAESEMSNTYTVAMIEENYQRKYAQTGSS